jgi:hypothetical protein
MKLSCHIPVPWKWLLSKQTLCRSFKVCFAKNLANTIIIEKEITVNSNMNDNNREQLFIYNGKRN